MVTPFKGGLLKRGMDWMRGTPPAWLPPAPPWSMRDKRVLAEATLARERRPLQGDVHAVPTPRPPIASHIGFPALFSLPPPFLGRRNWSLLWNVSLTVIALAVCFFIHSFPSEDSRECGAHRPP